MGRNVAYVIGSFNSVRYVRNNGGTEMMSIVFFLIPLVLILLIGILGIMDMP